MNINGVVKISEKALIVFLIVILFNLSFVNAVNITDDTTTEEIGEGLLYNVRSSIFKWFQKTFESVKYIFVENVKVYENESEKYSDYYYQRNERIKQSYLNDSEPPFNSSICAQSYPIDADTRFTFCSCGDGVCASYEDKCNCQKDCGSCPEETVCKRGECAKFIENTCMNTVCEEDENETCPWDCKVYMQEEKEEVLSEEEKEQSSERVRINREEFFRSGGMPEEEIAKALADAENESQEETLREEPED